MGLSGAVQWWEESQLRFLVLASLVIQYILLLASYARKFPIRSWFKPVIWLAYLGSDAVAIYALATLFNRHRKPQDDIKSILEVLWAPVLLIHLGGQDGITAYNIEDNELWTRHILTGVSQVTVSVYVFMKSWRGNDRRLLQAAILLFIPGILKCLEKPWALSRASINSLVSSDDPIRLSIITQNPEIDPLEDFIKKATTAAAAGQNDYLSRPARPMDFEPYNLFVDLASSSPDDRIRMLHSFSALNDNDAYSKLQHWLSQTFLLLYTKEKILPTIETAILAAFGGMTVSGFLVSLRVLAMYLPLASIALFHHSHRKDYSAADVKVTYALLCCTPFVDMYSLGLWVVMKTSHVNSIIELLKPSLDDMVSQYNLIGFLVRKRKHSKMTKIARFLQCEDFLHQHWRMKSCSSSLGITKLVLKYVKGGWKHHIRDVPSYRKFNDNRGQFTLGREGCYTELGWSLEGAFDESVLLWHLATDFCYYNMSSSQHGSDHHKRAVQCREISNYMMYLLFVNPEMLMAGTRRKLFTAAYEEISYIHIEGVGKLGVATKILCWIKQKILRARISFNPDMQCCMERQLTQKIIVAADDGRSIPFDSPKVIIRNAWRIAKVLSSLPEEKMLDVIEGVWVEMLCFSAARCRGYLHAKGLGTGVECLTYVWLLRYYMGMETLATKLQRVDHHPHGCNGEEHEGNPSSSLVSREATRQEQDAGPSTSRYGGTNNEEHARGQSAGYQGSDATGEEIV